MLTAKLKRLVANNFSQFKHTEMLLCSLSITLELTPIFSDFSSILARVCNFVHPYGLIHLECRGNILY